MSNQYGQPYGQQRYPPPQQQQQFYPPPQQQQQFYPPPPNQQYASPGITNAPPNYATSPLNYATSPLLNAHQDGKVAQKYNTRPKYNDVWAIVLFVAHLGAFIALSYLSIRKFLDRNNNSSAQFTLDDKAIILLAASAVLGFILSILYLLTMQRWPKAMIKISWVFSIILYFAAAAYYIYLGAYFAGIIYGIFGIFYAMTWWWWRSRLPFAVIMLETVTGITRKYPGTVLIGIAGLIIQVAYSVWWVITVVGAFQLFDSSANCTTTDPRTHQPNCTNYVLIGVMIFLVFSFYWTSQVIKTVGHVTVSGVFATFYFLEGTPMAPKSPTFSALGRALTTSFGSICFGSLIIALIQTIKAIIRSLASDTNSACGAFFAMCAVCFLDCIEGLVEYFNHYAYTEVAIYGKPFCEAAKDTWRLIKDRGVEAIINDNLVGNVLGMGIILIGAITALFSYAYVDWVKPTFNAGGNYTVVLVLICFLLGVMMATIVANVIDSGVATTFVALAEDPEALRRTKPELYQRIVQTWPRIVVGV